MTHAINIIKQEHRNYLALLMCLEHLVADLKDSDPRAHCVLFHAIVDYIESFLDRYHHPKEDEYLFRALRERHPDSEDLIRRLEQQHADGYDLLKELKAALENLEERGGPGMARFAEAAKTYQAHQYDHMRAEEMEVLPLARKHLSAADWQEIDAAFTAHDDPLFGDDRRAEYRPPITPSERGRGHTTALSEQSFLRYEGASRSVVG
jgi:branched-chain amino acid transport system ATP-binding protein